MDIWNECLDSFLTGMVVGLAMCIVISVCTFEIDRYSLAKEMIEYQHQLDEEFERQRLEAEGWLIE